ncbi:MAG: aminopeptidase P family N-terminal domain-containing protein, partial [Candidatus Aureabacteria bacterium]|nr:aminopeptidase P family N-terminal domain-containing protein [Candidatus Auribacterota bacterium]
MGYSGRLRRLRARMRGADLDGFLVLEPANVLYLSGFRGDWAWLLVAPRAAVLFTDFRFVEQAAREVPPAVRVREVKAGGWAEATAAVCHSAGLGRLGLEGEAIPRSTWNALERALGRKALRPVGDWVGDLRMAKEPAEVAAISRSARLAARVLSETVGSLRPGMTEAAVAAEIVCRIRRSGAREAFEPIVAFGPHSSQPHAVSGRRAIRGQGILLI